MLILSLTVELPRKLSITAVHHFLADVSFDCDLLTAVDLVEMTAGLKIEHDVHIDVLIV